MPKQSLHYRRFPAKVLRTLVLEQESSESGPGERRGGHTFRWPHFPMATLSDGPTRCSGRRMLSVSFRSAEASRFPDDRQGLARPPFATNWIASRRYKWLQFSCLLWGLEIQCDDPGDRRTTPLTLPDDQIKWTLGLLDTF